MTYSSGSNASANVRPSTENRNLNVGSDYYTRPTVEVSNTQRLDVTEQIIRFNELYGGSDNTRATGLAASKSLNYAKAPTLQQAMPYRVQLMPFTINFQNQVGLFGAENMYVRIDLDIVNFANTCNILVDDYYDACIQYVDDPPFYGYQQADIQPLEDRVPVNTYDPAEISGEVPLLDNPKIRIDVNNLKTGNIYIDNWLDVMVYTKRGEMWPFDTIYLNPKDFFYIGFHARNTRHLPFNVEAVVAGEFIDVSLIAEKELIDYGGY